MSDAWGWERGVLWAIDLPATGAAPVPPDGVRLAEAGAADHAALAVAMGVPEAEVAGRREQACRALVAWSGDELAAYCWLSTGRQRVGELARELVLPDGDAYVWDCATLPQFRGRGLYTLLLREMVRTLGAEGQRRIWIGASAANAASHRAFASAGFRPAIAMTALRLAGRGLIVRFRGAPGADPDLVADARRALTGH
jgi:ribosomal protein S18 acetylase RimI-like enzyme